MIERKKFYDKNAEKDIPCCSACGTSNAFPRNHPNYPALKDAWIVVRDAFQIPTEHDDTEAEIDLNVTPVIPCQKYEPAQYFYRFCSGCRQHSARTIFDDAGNMVKRTRSKT